MQVYTHPTDPSWEGFRPDSVFYGSEVGNRLPASSYASYDLVEAARSMLAVALQGMTYLPLEIGICHASLYWHSTLTGCGSLAHNLRRSEHLML